MEEDPLNAASRQAPPGSFDFLCEDGEDAVLPSSEGMASEMRGLRLQGLNHDRRAEALKHIASDANLCIHAYRNSRLEATERLHVVQLVLQARRWQEEQQQEQQGSGASAAQAAATAAAAAAAHGAANGTSHHVVVKQEPTMAPVPVAAVTVKQEAVEEQMAQPAANVTAAAAKAGRAAATAAGHASEGPPPASKKLKVSQPSLPPPPPHAGAAADFPPACPGRCCPVARDDYTPQDARADHAVVSAELHAWDEWGSNHSAWCSSGVYPRRSGHVPPRVTGAAGGGGGGGSSSSGGALITWDVPLYDDECATAVAMMATAEGTRMVLSGSCGTAYSVDVVSGGSGGSGWSCRRIGTLPSSLECAYSEPVFSSDGALVARGAMDASHPGVVSVLSPTTEALMYTPLHADVINAVAWAGTSSGGGVIISGGADGAVVAWRDVSVQSQPRGGQAAAGGGGGGGVGSDAAAGVQPHGVPLDAVCGDCVPIFVGGSHQSTRAITALYYSDGGVGKRHLYVGHSRAEVVVHDVVADATVQTLDLASDGCQPQVVHLGPVGGDSSLVLAALQFQESRRHQFVVADTRTQHRTTAVLQWTGGTLCPRPHASGHFVSCGGGDGSMFIWDLRRASAPHKPTVPLRTVTVAQPMDDWAAEKVVVAAHLLGGDGRAALAVCASGQVTLARNLL